MKIDLLKGKAPDILLMNALGERYSTEELFEIFKPGEDASKVEVKLTVNGFEVPFDTIVQNIWDHCEQVHDDEVVKRALELLNLAGLDDLKETIQRAREKVEMSLEELIRKVERK